LKWEYKRQVPDDLGKFIPVPSINRNLAIFANKIIDTSQDDFLFALDAVTGRLAWRTRIVNYRETSGPLIANGKIFSSRGCEFNFSPDGCIITAHDAVTGKELWRTRTIPKPGEPGDETWGGIPDAKRRHVGAWMVPSYDAELNMLYVGTSVTSWKRQDLPLSQLDFGVERRHGKNRVVLPAHRGSLGFRSSF